jgi:hypothetical protein
MKKIFRKMENKDCGAFKGYVTLKCFKKDGSLKWEYKGYNKMTNASLAVISGLLGNTGSQVAFTYLAVGSGTTAESNSLTALTTEITNHGLARASATVARATTTQTNDTLRLTKTWTASGGSSDTIQEIGIFNDASAGVMLARKLTGAKTVASGETLAATYDFVAVAN